MRRHACSSNLAIFSLFALSACDPVVIAGGDGGGGTGGGTASCTTTPTEPSTTCTVIMGTSSDTGSGTTGTWTFTGTDGTCSEHGGVCAQYVPDLGCPNGVWDDPTKHACSGDDANCCFPIVCTPGLDQTCNEDLTISSYAGHCNDNGLCTCSPGHQKVKTGKCL